jgi:uncharacterized protein HemX
MNDSQTKRRGPLLWLADCVRHRPVTTFALVLLLTGIAAVWTIGTVYISRQQRAAEQLELAQRQLIEVKAQQRQFLLQRLEQRQKSAEETPEPNSDESRAP